MNKKLLNNLACPQCHNEVSFNVPLQMIDCDICQLSYPITDGIVVMMPDLAKPISRAAQ